MKVESISRLKSIALVFSILAFAIIAIFEGVAIGDEQNNVPEPVLEISKTMTSGETTVTTRAREYWELEIVVTYNGQGDIKRVRVDDKIPKGVTLIGATPSKGKVRGIKDDEKRGKKGGKIKWGIGTMAQGDKETLTLKLTANFKKKGQYSLNKGATVTGKVDKTKITAGPTDPIVVYAERRHLRDRFGGGNWWR